MVYFGDDDNTYDIDLFQEIRATKKFSVWPVGICGGLRWEGPICEEGRLKEWHTSWAKMRPFPIDFAGMSLVSCFYAMTTRFAALHASIPSNFRTVHLLYLNVPLCLYSLAFNSDK